MLKDLFKKAAAVLVSAASVFALSATAFAAADNTVSFDVSAAPVIEPWSSYAISMEHYDPTKITSASEVIVNFTYEEVTPVAEGSEKECPVPLSLSCRAGHSPTLPWQTPAAACGQR